MRTVEVPSPATAHGADAEALIREARRRQRRRYLAAGMAVVAALAVALGALAGVGSARRSRPKTAENRPTRRTSPVLSGIAANVLMWPVGYPAFGPDGGPAAYVDNLRSGRLSEHQLGISAGDYQPLMIPVGRWLVYVGDGTSAIADDLKGTPRVLGTTSFFAPSSLPDHVWLIYYPARHGPVTVRSVAVAGGPPGPPLKLPMGSQLIEGTRAGLLLAGRSGDIELWRPGSSPQTLPYSPMFEEGFAASPLTVAYGSGCSDKITASNATYEPNAGYEACRVLRVLNVVTGRLLSFPMPPGTSGWVPNGFGLVDAISPGDKMIAAEAAIPPDGQGRVRLFVVSLAGAPTQPRTVPRSSAFLFARTAWSPDGSWLFYQGSNTRLSAYRVASGLARSSSTPCCRYTVMVATQSSP